MKKETAEAVSQSTIPPAAGPSSAPAPAPAPAPEAIDNHDLQALRSAHAHLAEAQRTPAAVLSALHSLVVSRYQLDLGKGDRVDLQSGLIVRGLKES